MANTRMGQDTFRWFVGVVEDINDPQKLGRVKVRIINEHDDIKIETNQLPWATPITPITSASHEQVGTSPTGIVVGSHVFGFYLDSNGKQFPMLWGTYAKMPDGTQKTNDLPSEAREINSVNNTLIGPEPKSSYAAKYPYNHVTKTKSGHIIEVDDTPGAERLRTYHKSGTYTEINKDGQEVSKIVGDGYEIVVKDKKVYVGGDCTITVLGNCTINAQKTVKLKSDKNSIVLQAPGGVQVLGGGLYTEGSLGSKLGQSGSFHTLDKVVTFVNGIITDIT